MGWWNRRNGAPNTRGYEAAAMFDASIVSDVLDFNTRVFPLRPVRPAVTGCTTTAPAVHTAGFAPTALPPEKVSQLPQRTPGRSSGSQCRPPHTGPEDCDHGTPPRAAAHRDRAS